MFSHGSEAASLGSTDPGLELWKSSASSVVGITFSVAPQVNH